jgi:WD40 repeat protein
VVGKGLLVCWRAEALERMDALSPVPMRKRVVEVAADLGEGVTPRWRYGSGLLIGDRTMLTAAHVLHDAVAVTVRETGKQTHQARLGTALKGDPGRLDLALLEVPGLAEPLPHVPVAVVDRDIETGEDVEDCWVVGYPAFQEIKRAGHDRATRVSAHVRGKIPPLSGLGDDLGLLSLHVTAAPRELPAGATLGQSEWSGMSGAAVFAGEMLVGVVAEHAPPRGVSEIMLTPLANLIDPQFAPADVVQWWKRLGVRDLAALPRLRALARQEEPWYRATLRTIRGHTKVLLGREDELSRIAAFATGSSEPFGEGTGSGGYLWLVGMPWAGKTALLAETVFTKPASVDVVAYFLTACKAEAASQQAFLVAVVKQLAWLLGIEIPETEIGIHAFRGLWARAAQQAENRGRYLLLIVDGLDEDLRPVGDSVAAALPMEHLGPHARVLVASRRYYELPDDVEVHHPLRAKTKTKVLLADSPHATELKLLARKEINALLPSELTEAPNDDLPFQILGLLTAAAGALSVRDLAAMTGVRAPTVRIFIASRAARSLEPVGSAEDLRYQFAHQTLYRYCQQHPDVGGDERYRDQLNEWAEDWRSREWPVSDIAGAGTPRYLLASYPAALMGDRADPLRQSPDPQRLVTLVTDIGWVEAAVQTAGVDSVVATLSMARSAAPADPRVSSMLAAVRGQVRHLRSPDPVRQPGYVLRQLCLQAAELGEEVLAAQLRTLLLPPGCRHLVPQWTTRRANRALMAELDGRWGWVNAVAVLPDGRVVSGGHDRCVRMWDPAGPGGRSAELGRHDGMVTAVAVTQDGQVVSGGTEGRVRMWNPAVPQAGSAISGRRDHRVTAIAVARYGVVSGGRDGRVLMWDPAAPDAGPIELGRHDGAVRAVRAVAVLQDGRVVSRGQDGWLLVWDPVAPGVVAAELGRHCGTALVSRRDGVVSGGHDGRLLIWDSAEPQTGPTELVGHGCTVTALAVLRDGRVVSGGTDGRVLAWNPASPNEPTELVKHDGWVNSVAVLPDGRVVSSWTNGWVRVWDPEQQETPGPVTCLQVACLVHAVACGVSRSGDSLLALAHKGGGMSVWLTAGAPRNS